MEPSRYTRKTSAAALTVLSLSAYAPVAAGMMHPPHSAPPHRQADPQPLEVHVSFDGVERATAFLPPRVPERRY